LSEQLNVPITRVGQITPGHELIVQDTQGSTTDIENTGWEHFRNEP